MKAVSTAIAALVGIILGSIVNVILYRLPRDRPMFHRPRCTGCGHPLTWELLPLAGYLIQRGRCRHSAHPIPAFFPLVELFSGTVFAILAWRLGINPLAGLFALFSLPLILTLFLDWQHHYIYYIVIAPATAIALLGYWLHPRLEVTHSLLGLGAGAAFFALLFFFGQVLFHSQALGLGDIWLAGMIGAMAGIYGTIIALAAGMFLAGLTLGVLLLVKKISPGDFVPYGSYLCLGALSYLCIWAP